jgi:hypothetical protein
MKNIPLNPERDGTSFTIKSNYYKVSLANFLRGGGWERPECVLPVIRIWKSHQNGWVYDPQGLCPTITVGQHSGVEPKIIVYE